MAHELDWANEILRGADQLVERSEAKDEVRFDTYDFVGMTRFHFFTWAKS